eukprot:CAMPEP_0171905468 /NCGR_PEP_ID=MMETSP0993-20121228/5232_1 /TAXON_ID=483369 /ORGANISM="non described non described, Strain CCMP2098" /LENGTH=31 /DNA_ID= /DNA_START= /DNA_END= /DNA_ORIENTATION=
MAFLCRNGERSGASGRQCLVHRRTSIHQQTH